MSKKLLFNIYVLASYPLLLVLYRIDYLSALGANTESDIEMFMMGVLFFMAPVILPLALLIRWAYDIGVYMVG